MSGRSSRLHALERGLKAPRKARANARALTVLRLEGGATGTQPDPRPARLLRLPVDMEDQIAVVRGRAVGKPSRGLLQLEQRLLGTHDADPKPPAIQRYDHGASPPVSVVPQSQARALATPMAGNAFAGRYNVESFEDTSTAIPGEPVGLPRTEYYGGTSPVTVDLPKTEFYAGAAPPPSIGTAPWEPTRVGAPAGAVPWAAEQSKRSVRQRALTQDQQAVTANFERDVAAMLGTAPLASAPEDQQWDNTVRNAANASPTASTSAANTPQAPTGPQRDAHEVFNQMGLAMNYANRFDLGAMDLSARFDHFDSELAPTPKATPMTSASAPVQALSLDDFDLVADLAEISGAQSATTPMAAAPTNQPTTNPEQATTPAT